MSKELVVSSTRHETRLGVLENDQLVEIFVERESQEGLAGSIHKGRVTRVLPGMQSAFVDVGLERDAFLYVSDFVDSSSEFDDSEEEGSSSGSKRRKSGRSRRKPARDSEAKPENEAEAKPEAESEPEPDKEQSEAGAGEERDREGGRDRRGRRRRGRRGRRRGGREGKEGLPESKYADLADKDKKGDKVDESPESKPAKAAEPRVAKAPEEEEDESSFELLPGESLAKYGDADEDDRYADEPDDSDEDSDSDETEESPESDEDATPDDSDRAEQEADESDEEDPTPEEDDDEEDQGDESDDEDDESDDEDDDEDDGPDFAHDLEEAERLAALVEEQDAENGEESDEESEDGDASEDESDPEDDQAEDDSDFETDDDETEDQQDDQSESEAGDTENDRDGEDQEPDSEDSGDNEENSVEQPGEPQEKGADNASEHAREEQSASGVTMPGAPLDEADDDADKPDDASGEEGEASVPGQPDSARVRDRSGSSRNLQRRGRRGRRRGGRGRDNRQPVQEKEPQERERRKPMREPMQVSGSNTSEYKITDMLQKGNEILIQIAKEPLGKKGARITSHIALPGRFLVYMPTVDHVGVSRKISTFDERKRLRNIVRTHRTGMPGGFIVRTAGDGIPEEEIRGDMLFLYNLWLDIRQKAEEREHPGLVHQDLDIVERILRDQLDDDFKAIWVDDESEYERVLRFVERFQPSLLPKVKLYTRAKPIFEEFNVHTAIEKALRAKVWLKSGGYLVINQTEALVSVDVNTGKYVGKSDRLEDTIVNTNVEAARELVRQLRLRDLGGIIVVDFIDMDDRKNRQKVLQALDQELKSDRAPSKVLQFNDFGLVAITRKRVKQSLERTLCDPCPTCSGLGSLKSVTTVIFEILAEAKKMAPGMEPQKDITLRVNPEVARTLKDRQNSFLQELETILKSRILVRSDGSLHRENFDVN